MNYIQMRLKNPKTDAQIKDLISEVSSPRGAGFLLKRARALNVGAARQIAYDIEKSSMPAVSRAKKAEINTRASKFRDSLL